MMKEKGEGIRQHQKKVSRRCSGSAIDVAISAQVGGEMLSMCIKSDDSYS